MVPDIRRFGIGSESERTCLPFENGSRKQRFRRHSAFRFVTEREEHQASDRLGKYSFDFEYRIGPNRPVRENFYPVKAGIVHSREQFVRSVAVEVLTDERMDLNDVPKEEHIALREVPLGHLSSKVGFGGKVEREVVQSGSANPIGVQIAGIAT